jgi:phosphoserine aminotransferase
LENAENFQTHYTPNVFGIYLLYRVLQDIPEIQHVDQKTRERMGMLENTIAKTAKLRMLIQNPEARSSTVLAITGREEMISEVKKSAEKEGMQMGGGYGPLKASSFRIANFPAISDSEFENLIGFLKKY